MTTYELQRVINLLTEEMEHRQRRAERLAALEDGGRKDASFAYSSEFEETYADGIDYALRLIRGEFTESEAR